MSRSEKIVIILLTILALGIVLHEPPLAETAVGTGYDNKGKPFTNWMFTDEGAGGTVIVNGGTRRTGITYIYGAGAGVRARERESAFWTANPLGKGFNK